MLFLAIWECVSLQQKWRNTHFVENHVISRTFIHHLYMELKISHGSILFGGGAWRPPSPTHQYASAKDTVCTLSL